MKHSEESSHLLAAYRQLDQAGRAELVHRILTAACAKIGQPAEAFDALVPACLAIETSGTLVQRAAAGLARQCVRWIETGGIDDSFSQIALTYGQLDSRGGRPEGAITAKTRYLRKLVSEHPGQSAKALHTIALLEAQCRETPFGDDAGELYDKATDKPVNLRGWEKLVSEAKNPKKL